MEINDALAAAGYLMLSISPLTQVAKTLRQKNSAQVSLFWPLFLILGMALIIPGLLNTNSWVLIIGHFTGMTTNILNFVLILVYRKPRSTSL